jgi:tRNA(fMet)-specific endonuclease VapC
MTIYLLDSNVCIDALRDPFGRVALNISGHIGNGDKIVTSRIVQYELEVGARSSAKPSDGLANIARLLADGISVLAFDGPAAQAAAKLTRDTQMKGFSLQAFDSLIAGHAIALGATLVTADAKLTEAVSEIEVVNWR